MTSFDRGAVVLVPFPYTDRDRRYERPAVVVSQGSLGGPHLLIWVVMVTAAENARWRGDVEVGPPAPATGLRKPSIVRTAKIVNVELAACRLLGVLPADVLGRVMREVLRNLGVDPKPEL